jgi:RHS repeat-associated protein
MKSRVYVETPIIDYDANGNLTNDGQRSYTWNARNELSSLSPVGTSTVPPASFQYDPMGRRVGKTLNPASTPATTGYLYDGANFVQEINEANNTQSGTDANQASLIANLLTAGIDSTVLRQRLTATGTTITASTPEHFLRDANNNTIAITNAATTPAITTRYDYSAYGESTTTTVSGTQSDNSQQYTGRENDQTGLMYYRARYYNPACARFISEDPIGWASGQVNNYAYVAGNPVGFRDPSGNFGHIIGGAVIGAVGGAIGNGFMSWTQGCGFWNTNAMINGAIGGAIGGAITAAGSPAWGGGIGAGITEILNQGINPFKPKTWPNPNDNSSIVPIAAAVIVGAATGGVSPNTSSETLNNIVNQTFSIGLGTAVGNTIGVASGGSSCPK